MTFLLALSLLFLSDNIFTVLGAEGVEWNFDFWYRLSIQVGAFILVLSAMYCPLFTLAYGEQPVHQ